MHSLLGFVVVGTVLLGCAETRPGSEWTGTLDTLPGGLVRISNPEVGLWDAETQWHVVEEVRLGAMDGEGPEVFGQITDLAVDGDGRIYVFEGQAQELRVFDRAGQHVRTIGRKGGGPGEFAQVIGMDWSPEGNLWLIDPRNNRISVLDTAGTFLTSHTALGGIVVMPWPGGFDTAGRFYTYGLDPETTEGFGLVLVRFGDDMQPIDSTVPPRWQGEDNFFEARSEHGYVRASVPYSPSVTWRLARSGNIWFALTGEYEIYERTFEGDTLRMISRDFEQLPVTNDDIDAAIEDMDWFTRQGGRVDRSKFPDVKPAVETFFVSDGGFIWALPVMPGEEDERRALDVFDPNGRYLGRVQLPFRLQTNPAPVFFGTLMYAVTLDELDVPYIVRVRIGTSDSRDTGTLSIGG